MRVCLSLACVAVCGVSIILSGCTSFYQAPADLQESSVVTLVASHVDNGEIELRTSASAIDGEMIDPGLGDSNWNKPVKIAPGEHIITIAAASRRHYTGWRAFAEALSSAPSWTRNSTAILAKFEAGKVYAVRGKMHGKFVAGVWLEGDGGSPITKEQQMSLVRDVWRNSGAFPFFIPGKK